MFGFDVAVLCVRYARIKKGNCVMMCCHYSNGDFVMNDTLLLCAVKSGMGYYLITLMIDSVN